MAKAVHSLALAMQKLLIEHGSDVIERQFHQERLANARIFISMAMRPQVRTITRDTDLALSRP